MGRGSGAAVGFKLDSLLKLTDTRARNNKMTLMHYLCKVRVNTKGFVLIWRGAYGEERGVCRSYRTS